MDLPQAASNTGLIHALYLFCLDFLWTVDQVRKRERFDHTFPAKHSRQVLDRMFHDPRKLSLYFAKKCTLTLVSFFPRMCSLTASFSRQNSQQMPEPPLPRPPHPLGENYNFFTPVPSINWEQNFKMADDRVVKIVVLWKRQQFLLFTFNYSFSLHLSCFGRFFEMLLRGGYLRIPRVFFRGQDSLGYARLPYVLMLFQVTFVMVHIEG